jgi:hypothetical protein
MYIRFKSSQHMITTGGTHTGGEEDLNIHLSTAADYMNDFIEDFEDKLAKDKAKKKADKTVKEESKKSEENKD